MYSRKRLLIGLSTDHYRNIVTHRFFVEVCICYSFWLLCSCGFFSLTYDPLSCFKYPLRCMNDWRPANCWAWGPLDVAFGPLEWSLAMHTFCEDGGTLMKQDLKRTLSSVFDSVVEKPSFCIWCSARKCVPQ